MSRETTGRPVSATGGAKETKLARFDQIPSSVLWELAEHYGKGNAKYPAGEDGIDNWRKGYPWSLSYSAAQRHLSLFWQGEDIDEETGSKHLIAAGWHCLAMAFWLDNAELAEQFDDRQDKPVTQPSLLHELWEAFMETTDPEPPRHLFAVDPSPSGGFGALVGAVIEGEDVPYVRLWTESAAPPEEVITELDIDPRELADGHYEDQDHGPSDR